MTNPTGHAAAKRTTAKAANAPGAAGDDRLGVGETLVEEPAVDKRAHAFLDIRRQQRRVILEDGVVERRGKLAHLEQFFCGASR